MYKYQRGQVLIALIKGKEEIVVIETPYDNGGQPYYETEEGHDFHEDELKEVSESQMEMTLEGAERLADLHIKRDILRNQWRAASALGRGSSTCKVYAKSLNLIRYEIKKLKAFYVPR